MKEQVAVWGWFMRAAIDEKIGPVDVEVLLNSVTKSLLADETAQDKMSTYAK